MRFRGHAVPHLGQHSGVDAGGLGQDAEGAGEVARPPGTAQGEGPAALDECHNCRRVAAAAVVSSQAAMAHRRQGGGFLFYC